MATRTVTFDRPSSVMSAPAHRVYVRAKWSEAWTEVKYLWCERALWSAAPGISQAELSWRYGYGRRQFETEFGIVALKDDQFRVFVKIEIDVETLAGVAGPLVWYGTWEAQADRQLGLINRANADGTNQWIDSGRQTILCYGLELALARWPITKGAWLDPKNVLRETERGLTFNKDGKGNRSATQYHGVYLFSKFGEDKTNKTFWSTQDIFMHLMAIHVPVNRLGTSDWKLDIASAKSLPNWDKPEIPTDNRTLFDVLNTLLPAERLLSWRVQVNATANTINVIPFSLADADIKTEAGTFVKNDSPVNVDYELAPHVEASLQQSGVGYYDQVIVRGARARVCFPVSWPDQTLGVGWTIDEEEEYEQAASLIAGYGPNETRFCQAMNAIARARDSVRRVFVRFGLFEEWDYLAGNGTGGAKTAVFSRPLPDTTGRPYSRELAILPTLPLQETYDYSGDKIAKGTFAESGDPPFPELRPIVLFKTPDARYVNIEKRAMAGELEDEQDGDEVRLSGSVHVVPGTRFFEIHLHGAPAHAIANTDFDSLAADEDRGLGDWRDMIATIALEDDRYCEGRYPADSSLPKDRPIRRLVIEAGDVYRLDKVHPQTPLGVDAAGALIRSDGGTLRDDGPAAHAKAQLAYRWYSRERTILRFSTSQLSAALAVGDLIVTAGSKWPTTINTVITRVEVTIPGGSDGRIPPPRIEYETAFGDLSPLQF